MPGSIPQSIGFLRHSRQGLLDRKLDWQQADALEAINRERTGQVLKEHKWFITKQGETFSVIRGPVEFTMGAPGYEPGRA